VDNSKKSRPDAGAVTPPRQYRDDFFMAKDFRTYTNDFLRQEKILRDQGND
jgi:hypothetical protein